MDCPVSVSHDLFLKALGLVLMIINYKIPDIKLFISFVIGAGVCPDPSVCDVNAVCAYSNSQAFCSCKAGFSGDGNTCVGWYFVQILAPYLSFPFNCF
jgi:hypothetical protein